MMQSRSNIHAMVVGIIGAFIAFGCASTSHQDGPSLTTPMTVEQDDSGLTLDLKITGSSVSVLAEVTLTNRSAVPVLVNRRLAYESYPEDYGDVAIQFDSANGPALPTAMIQKADMVDDNFQYLAPGSSIVESIDLTRFIKFERVEYFVTATYSNQEQPENLTKNAWVGTIVSEPVQFSSELESPD
jgi:hypothetical protein